MGDVTAQRVSVCPGAGRPTATMLTPVGKVIGKGTLARPPLVPVCSQICSHLARFAGVRDKPLTFGPRPDLRG